MNEPSAEKDAVEHRAIRYTDGTAVVLLVVPWGLHSGMIPPPGIEIGGRWFQYAGSSTVCVTPPGVGA